MLAAGLEVEQVLPWADWPGPRECYSRLVPAQELLVAAVMLSARAQVVLGASRSHSLSLALRSA